MRNSNRIFPAEELNMRNSNGIFLAEELKQQKFHWNFTLLVFGDKNSIGILHD
jgi:hypothetical protein